jgi:hypothetical protein
VNPFHKETTLRDNNHFLLPMSVPAVSTRFSFVVLIIFAFTYAVSVVMNVDVVPSAVSWWKIVLSACARIHWWRVWRIVFIVVLSRIVKGCASVFVVITKDMKKLIPWKDLREWIKKEGKEDLKLTEIRYKGKLNYR